MKLTVLGSGSCLSNSERAASGYLLESGINKLVLDLGFGCFKNLQKACNPLDVSALAFSHFSHPDHVSDLVAFLMHRKVSVKRGAVPKQLNLFGPHGFNAFFQKLIEAFPFFYPMNFPIKATELQYDKAQIFGFDIKTKPASHMDGNAIAFRIESEGKALMYSGDTEYCDALIELGRNVNLMILECSSPAAKMDGHLNPDDCAKIAKTATPKALMLSHLYPETEGLNFEELISPRFPGKIIKAEDLLRVEF